MPRRFFRKFAVKRHEFSEKWFLSPFRHLMHDHRLWAVRRKNVVPAVAVGAFFAFMPFPGHPIWASFASLALRINVPIAAITTFISNPLTMGPMYFLAYRFGAWILGVEQQDVEIEMSFDWVAHSLIHIWQPMLLGCVLLGTASALVAYVTLDLLWRSSLGSYKTRKREKRNRND